MVLGASSMILLLLAVTKLAQPFFIFGPVCNSFPSPATYVATTRRHFTFHNPPFSRAQLARPFCTSGSLHEATEPTAAKSVATILDMIISNNPPFSRAQLSEIASAAEEKLYSMPLEPENVPTVLKDRVTAFYEDRVVWNNGDVTDIDVEQESGLMHAGTAIWESHTAEIGPMTIYGTIPDSEAYVSGFEELSEEWKSKHGFKTDLEVCTALEWIFGDLRLDHENIVDELSRLRRRLEEKSRKDV